MGEVIEKGLVVAFLKFVRNKIEEDKFTPDQVESLEVAIQCLEATFETNGPHDPSATELVEVLERAEHMDLYEIFESAFVLGTPNREQEAEKIKNEGNRLMKEGKTIEALLQYNKAIRLDPTNPIFYCNRAAAFTKVNEFHRAITDCKLSLAYNPNYGKAYGRLGLAYSSLNKFDEAREAYKKAIELEPNNMDYVNNLRLLEKRAEMNPIGLATSAIQNMPNNDFRRLLQEALGDPSVAQTISQMFTGDYSDIMDRTRQIVTELVNNNPSAFNIAQMGIGGNQQQQQQQGPGDIASGSNQNPPPNTSGVNTEQQGTSSSANMNIEKDFNPTNDGKNDESSMG